MKYYAHHAHGHSDYMLQGYAAHLNDQESTFDITVYGKIEKLHYSLLALQYTAISIIFVTLLLRIRFISFANEINKKLNRVSESLSRLSKGATDDVIPNNQKNKSTWEYTIPYFLSLAIFIGWDLVQYKHAKKISKTEWFYFFPIPCIAPIIIGVSFGVSILLFIWYYKKNTDKNKKECLLDCHHIVNFPILTGLSVFFVFHGSWMLLMFGAYPNLVIIRSLFLLPLFFFIIALLPRMIKALYNLYKEYKEEKIPKDFTSVYGFSVTVLIAIPLLIVLYFASDYILVVTDIHDDPLKLLIALAVILGVPYYLILLWDSNNQETKETKVEKNGEAANKCDEEKGNQIRETESELKESVIPAKESAKTKETKLEDTDDKGTNFLCLTAKLYFCYKFCLLNFLLGSFFIVSYDVPYY